MPEPARVHRPRIEHELPKGRETSFRQKCREADAPRPDLDQAAVQHGSGRGWQLGLAFLRTGLPGPEKQTVSDPRADAKVDPEFLAQPGALGEGEGRGGRLSG